MNAAHVHVALNHFPVVGAIIAAVILITGMIKKNDSMQQVSLWIFTALAVIAIPVLLTGEGAEEIVEHLPGVDEETIERHVQLARITFWLLITTGLHSISQLYLIKIKKQTGKLMIVIAILSVIVSGSAGLTANAGGKIRHHEFENAAFNKREEIKAEEQEETKSETDKGRGRKRKGRDH